MNSKSDAQLFEELESPAENSSRKTVTLEDDVLQMVDEVRGSNSRKKAAAVLIRAGYQKYKQHNAAKQQGASMGR